MWREDHLRFLKTLLWWLMTWFRTVRFQLLRSNHELQKKSVAKKQPIRNQV
jgi:hypothetical protein